MDDKNFLLKILKLKAPWFITKVVTDEELQQIDVWVDHEKHIQVMCQNVNSFTVYTITHRNGFAFECLSDENVYSHKNAPG